MKKITFENTVDKLGSINPLLAFPLVILWSWSGAIKVLKYSIFRK
ncbi:MAG: hypothetical protein AABY22_25050 [Nanoarchaeota archaeon]